MKYSLLLIAFAFSCTALCAAETQKAPQQIKAQQDDKAKAKAEAEAKAKAEAEAKAKAKAEAEAKAKAEAEAKAKAKAEAEAKAKAEAEAKAKAKAEAEAKARAEAARLRAEREKNRNLSNAFRDNYQKVFQNGTPDEIRKIMENAVPLFGKDGAMTKDAGLGCAMNLEPMLKRRRTKASADDLIYILKLFLKDAQGDFRADVMRRMADICKAYKPGSEAECAKLKADSYKITGLSKIKLFELYIDDGELAKADALVPAIFKDQQEYFKANPKMTDNARAAADAALWKRIIGTFQKKRVYASSYVKKWMEARIAAAPSADAKIPLINEYADFLDLYAMVTDEELEKILAGRYTLPGLTNRGKAQALIYDYKKEDDPELALPIREKIMEAVKDEKDLRLNFYVYGIFYRHRNKTAEGFRLADFYENVIMQDPAIISNPSSIRSNLEDYVRFMASNQSYENLEKFLLKYLQNVKPEAAYMNAVRYGLAAFYEKFAERYYEKPDPIMLRKAMAQYIMILADTTDPKALSTKMALRSNIARLAWKSGDSAEAFAQVKATEDLTIPDNTYSAKRDFLNIRRYAGLAAYDEGRYQEAVDLLLPAAQFQGTSDQLTLEHLIRAYTALGKYDEALKYTDKLLNSVRQYMRSRFETMIDSLKERAAAAAKAGN